MSAETYRAWVKANPDKVRAYRQKYRARTAEQQRIAARAYRAANLEKVRESNRRSRAANREKVRESNRKARAAHLDRHCATQALRRAAKLQRTPAWADLGKIRSIYTDARGMAALLGEPWHVDHVIPLCGERVSGLHVHANLQLLPGRDNIEKSNRYELS